MSTEFIIGLPTTDGRNTSIRMKLAEYVVCLRGKRNNYDILFERPHGKMGE
jgi:hypothetical protein